MVVKHSGVIGSIKISPKKLFYPIIKNTFQVGAINFQDSCTAINIDVVIDEFNCALVNCCSLNWTIQ